jgi:hydroxymethylpyrimidine pyrophosphatase-like HAD family hydrolase
MKGIIALDIDGTITANHHHLEPNVAKFLKSLVQQDWVLVFITGRTFSWGYEVLEGLDFPYYFAVHNGVTILQMPSRDIIFRQLIPCSCIPLIDTLFIDQPNDYTIYCEEMGHPICYYRPEQFSPPFLDYLKKRSEFFKEKWIPVETFTDLPISEFSALKFFAVEPNATIISSQLESLDFHAPIIKDPFDTNVCIIQATHGNVSKGKALEQLKVHLSQNVVTIAAGDDNNDATMLAVADIRVVMETAPKNLLNEAHIIAPSAKKMGIIQGLIKAIILAETHEKLGHIHGTGL